MSEPKTPKDVRRLLKAGWLADPGEATRVAIRHAEDCACWKTGDPRDCDCKVAVELVERGDS